MKNIFLFLFGLCTFLNVSGQEKLSPEDADKVDALRLAHLVWLTPKGIFSWLQRAGFHRLPEKN